MSIEEYVRRHVRRIPRPKREVAAATLREELQALADEAVADGLPEHDAVARALEIHHESAPHRLDPWSPHAFLTAPWSPWTWRGAAYLSLLFPVGLLSFIWAVGGLGLILGAMLLLLGVFLAVPFLLTFPVLGRMHGALATWATGQPMPTLRTTVRAEGTRLQRTLQHARDPQIVFGYLSCLVAFAFGQIGFGLVAGVGAGIVFMVSAPFTDALPAMPGGGQAYPDWLLDNEWGLAAVGVAVFWLWTWGLQALSWLSARATRGVLTRS